MKVVRIIQLVLLLLLSVYLVLLGYANPQTIRLPFLLWLPTVWVVTAALLLGFLVGWALLIGRVLRLNRQNKALHQRLIKAGLEAEPTPEPSRREPLPPTR